jgi:HEPN domain-containing protein
VIGFHLQQAAEKSLKAVPASGELEIPHTHDLELLAELARGLAGADLPEAVERAKWLTPWGVVFRYDDDTDDLDRDAALEVATEAIALAERMLDERRSG